VDGPGLGKRVEVEPIEAWVKIVYNCEFGEQLTKVYAVEDMDVYLTLLT
jgi:hypothetical protein